MFQIADSPTLKSVDIFKGMFYSFTLQADIQLTGK